MILGEKTRLRAIEREDIPTFVRWFNDPEVRRYLEMYLPMSKAEEEQWFEAYLKNDSSRFFGIETGEGVLIGNVGLHSIDWKNRSAVLGIVIAEKEYWGRGYGSDAITTLLRFAFGEMNLHRIHLSVFDFNEGQLAATRSAALPTRDEPAKPCIETEAITIAYTWLSSVRISSMKIRPGRRDKTRRPLHV